MVLIQPLTSGVINAKELSLPYYFPIAGRGKTDDTGSMWHMVNF